MRLVQHKKEAYWFYRFLSLFYDDYVNPFFWTQRMRDAALELAALNDRCLKVLDVGAGTGFTTEGIVARVDASNVTCLDQSPHQLERARARATLEGCTIVEGDAEALPLADDTFDRYVSAGSIEYWPDPQRGVAEAYRVLKPEGIALMIGPLRPKGFLARLVADTWMLFPGEDDYIRWFRKAGFINIKKRYVAPSWVRRELYGIAISGVKAGSGPAPLEFDPSVIESLDAAADVSRILQLVFRVVSGSLAGFVFIPVAIFGTAYGAIGRVFGRRTTEPVDPLTPHQVAGIAVFTAIVTWVFLSLFRSRRQG